MEHFSIDSETEFGSRTLQRLNDESVIWLVTVRKDLTPQPSPVWFWWNGDTLLIFSQPSSQKIRNIKNNNKIALHFDSDGDGGNIVILNGYASILEDQPPDHEMEGYMNKYREGIKELDMIPKSFRETYSAPIRVILYRLRGH